MKFYMEPQTWTDTLPQPNFPNHTQHRQR